jgi:hypothetical protein
MNESLKFVLISIVFFLLSLPYALFVMTFIGDGPIAFLFYMVTGVGAGAGVLYKMGMLE